MTRRTDEGASKCALRHFRRDELTVGEYFMPSARATHKQRERESAMTRSPRARGGGGGGARALGPAERVGIG
jgi:hypothetical protein